MCKNLAVGQHQYTILHPNDASSRTSGAGSAPVYIHGPTARAGADEKGKMLDGRGGSRGGGGLYRVLPWLIFSPHSQPRALRHTTVLSNIMSL